MRFFCLLPSLLLLPLDAAPTLEEELAVQVEAARAIMGLSLLR